MILGADGEALVVGIDAGAARHRPAFQHAVHLQPEIPMEAGGVVFLDDEEMAGSDAPRALRLARPREIALGVVGRERIGFAGGGHHPHTPTRSS